MRTQIPCEAPFTACLFTSEEQALTGRSKHALDGEARKGLEEAQEAQAGLLGSFRGWRKGGPGDRFRVSWASCSGASPVGAGV